MGRRQKKPRDAIFQAFTALTEPLLSFPQKGGQRK